LSEAARRTRPVDDDFRGGGGGVGGDELSIGSDSTSEKLLKCFFLENLLWLLWSNLISDSVDESYSTIIFFEFWDREDFVFLRSSFEELRC
jgi:hypothetical protein